MNENTTEMNGDIFSKEKFITDTEERGDKFLHFSNHGDFEFDTDGFDNTKITDAKFLVDGVVYPLEKISTWAGLLRSVNNEVKKYRKNTDSIFEECFNDAIRGTIEKYGLGMNSNFSTKLFDDDSFIKSSIYLNNENHALEVWNGKKICAVYAGEVVVVLNALIASAGNPETDETIELLVSYKKRERKEIDSNECVNIKEQIINAIKPYAGAYQDKYGNKFILEIKEDSEFDYEKISDLITDIENNICDLKELLNIK